MTHSITPQTLIDGEKLHVVRVDIAGDAKDAAEIVAQTILDTGARITLPSFHGAGLNDASFTGTFTGTQQTAFTIEVDSVGATDKFKWSLNGGATWEATGVSMTGAAQLLSLGISVTLAATTGHTLHDRWVCIGKTAYTNNKLFAIEYNLNGFSAQLLWDATTDVPLLSIPKDFSAQLEFSNFGGYPNNAGTGKTGKILITTAGIASTAAVGYVTVTVLRK